MAASTKRNRNLLSLTWLSLFLLSVYIVNVECHGHGHSHDEPAHHKYSKEANEPVHDVHSHSHDMPAHHKYSKEANEPASHHGHAHSHGEHGHSHNQHDHGHSHNHHGHSHDHGHHEVEENSNNAGLPPRASDSTVWLQAIGSTALISIAPVFILILIPIGSHTGGQESFLKVLLSFASGGLLGDAFLHLIPHAMMAYSSGNEGEGHSHSHSHSHHGHSHGDGHSHSSEMSVGLWVLAGIVAFLAVEKFVRHVKGGHGHSHGAPKESTEKPKVKEAKDKKDAKSDKKENKSKEVQENNAKSDIKVSAYLNLAADFTHNFTDGLAIGSSYLAGQNIGMITTLAILFHEVPHEVGDFAILVQSGFSKTKAMKLQFSTALGAMCGTVVSLFAGGVGEAAVAWILPFTAGGFIYIATVSVIPELLEDCKPWQSLKEIIALLIGVYMMVLIAMYE